MEEILKEVKFDKVQTEYNKMQINWAVESKLEDKEIIKFRAIIKFREWQTRFLRMIILKEMY